MTSDQEEEKSSCPRKFLVSARRPHARTSNSRPTSIQRARTSPKSTPRSQTGLLEPPLGATSCDATSISSRPRHYHRFPVDSACNVSAPNRASFQPRRLKRRTAVYQSHRRISEAPTPVQFDPLSSRTIESTLPSAEFRMTDSSTCQPRMTRKQPYFADLSQDVRTAHHLFLSPRALSGPLSAPEDR